jgi:uncharacterized protein DUF4383
VLAPSRSETTERTRMAATRTSLDGPAEGRHREDRSPAQWFCLIVGATLVLLGLLGFLAEAKFDTAIGGDPGQLDGEDFLIFEVNGWHNVVHILSGLFLLAFAARRAAARAAALAFGAIYAVVSLIGLIDGKDVLGIIPIDRADNVLHVLLALFALAAGLLSGRDRGADRVGDPLRSGEAARPGTVSSRAGSGAVAERRS